MFVRTGQGCRSVTTGGAERSRVAQVLNGRVRIRSGRMGTQRIERWLERVPWSPSVMEPVNSSRSPMRVARP